MLRWAGCGSERYEVVFPMHTVCAPPLRAGDETLLTVIVRPEAQHTGHLILFGLRNESRTFAQPRSDLSPLLSTTLPQTEVTIHRDWYEYYLV